MSDRTKIFLVVVLFLLAGVSSYAQSGNDLDNYRWRLEGNWWFSHPSGYLGLQGSKSGYFDVSRDFGFEDYSTFTGKVDWRFGRKHHLLLSVNPTYSSRTTTLSRTIDFGGQTFFVNTQVKANLDSLNVRPGYQYDIIRRDHGFLGVEVYLNVIRTTGKLSALASAGGSGVAYSASNTIWAPLPAVGPAFRWYPLHDSNRLAFDGSLTGMPFFGYGNFLSARGSVDVGLTKHLALRGGYEMGSRLSIHGTSDQIAVKLTHKGPTAGLEYSFGEAPPKKVKAPSNQPSYWHVDWVPFYLWFSGLHGNVGAGGFVAPVSASFADIFSQLNIGLMTNLDVRRKRIGVFTDLIFMTLSSDQKTTPIPPFVGFTSNAKELILDPEVYVRLLERDRGSVDVVGGGRFWHMNNNLDLFPANTNQSSVTVGQTQSWIDPVLGARFRLNLNKGFFVNVKGDAGGFGVGSQLTYQIYSGLGKEFKQKYSMLLGYRYLSVDYKNGGFVYDTSMSGILAGFAIRFK